MSGLRILTGHIMTEDERHALPYRPNVGLMVLNGAGHVFVAQRLDYPSAAWQMPQGGIDAGEDPQTAALRELFEETGITKENVEILAQSAQWLHYDFPADLAVKLMKGRYRGQKQRWFLLRFTGADHQINIETEEPEFSAWRWMPVDGLIDNIVAFKRDVYKKVIAEFQDYL